MLDVAMVNGPIFMGHQLDEFDEEDILYWGWVVVCSDGLVRGPCYLNKGDADSIARCASSLINPHVCCVGVHTIRAVRSGIVPKVGLK